MLTRIGLFLLLLAAALAASNCGVFTNFPHFTSRSPDGHAVVRVMRNMPGSDAEYVFRVEVSTAQERTVVYRHNRGASIGLVEAHWSADSGQVGLLICNRFGGGPVLISYDLANRRSLSPSVFRQALEEQIRSKYSLTDEADVIRWACSNEGLEAYRHQR